MNTDRLLGATAIAVATIMLVFGYGLQAPFAYEPVGPRAFPLIAAGIIALCGVILVIKPGAPSAEPAGPVGALVALSGCLLGYAFLFQPLGFVIATTIFIVPIAMIFGAKWWQGALTGLALAVSSYLLFDRVLDVVLPVGPFGGIV